MGRKCRENSCGPIEEPPTTIGEFAIDVAGSWEENTAGEPEVLNVEINDKMTRLPCVLSAAEAVVEVEIEGDGDCWGKADAV